LMAAIAVCGMSGLASLNGIAQRLLSQDVQLAQHAAEIHALVLQERRFEKDSFINLADDTKLASYAKKWDDTRGKLLKTIDAVRTLELTPDDAQATEQIARHFAS